MLIAGIWWHLFVICFDGLLFCCYGWRWWCKWLHSKVVSAMASSSGGSWISSLQSPRVMLSSAGLSNCISSTVGVQDSQHVASRTCVEQTRMEFLPTCIYIDFRSRSSARNLPRHHAPRLCCLALAFCLHNATA